MLIVWFCLLLLESTLAILLWMMRHDRRYPAFTLYITFQVAETIALETLYLLHADSAYFYVYGITFCVDVFFKLAVLIELFHTGFQTELMPRAVSRRMHAVVGVIGVVAFACSLRFPSSYPDKLMMAARTADTWASVGLCLVLVAIFVGAAWEGVWWLNRPRGIALGLALYLPTRLAIRFIGHSAGRQTMYWLSWVELFTYLGTLLIWIRTFIVPEIHRVTINAATLRQRVRELDVIRRALK